MTEPLTDERLTSLHRNAETVQRAGYLTMNIASVELVALVDEVRRLRAAVSRPVRMVPACPTCVGTGATPEGATCCRCDGTGRPDPTRSTVTLYRPVPIDGADGA